MRLQIKDGGSWRHVMVFDSADEQEVRQRAVKLVSVVNERAKLRILSDQGNPRATCRGPEFRWEEHSK